METRCTFCEKVKFMAPGENMCADCDVRAIRAEKQFKVRQLNAGRACRKCGGPTGAGRYFHCTSCVEMLEPSSDWDEFDDIDEVCREVCAGIGLAKAAKFTGPKVCRTCKVSKERSQFGRMTRAKDGLDSECRACESIKRAARRKQEKQDALLEKGRVEDAVEALQLGGIQLPLHAPELSDANN